MRPALRAVPSGEERVAAPGFLRRDGATYDHAIDGKRLGEQHQRVFDCMRDGRWRSLREIAETTGDPEASVSARLRDFRKPRFGGHEVERRRARDGGTHEYRLLLATRAPAEQGKLFT
ncbi:MAG TPA: hypothetical protein VMU47_11030 [Caldimonas sp.]|nr:hypothetical protein [Caldimonas sp.]